MKKILKAILMFLLIMLFVYIWTAFINLELNPLIWSKNVRGSFTAVTIVFGFVVNLIYFIAEAEIKSNKNKR